MDILGNFSNLKGDNKKRFARTKEVTDFSYSDVSIDPIGKVEEKEKITNLFSIKVITISVFCLLILKLFFLQVVNGQTYQKSANNNRIKLKILEATRGAIHDSSGNLLVSNKPEFVLALDPSELPKKTKDRDEIYQKLSQIIQIPVSDIKKEAEANGLLSLQSVYLKENISHDDALVLKKKIADIAAVSIETKSVRQYVTIPGLSHLLGYAGKVSEKDLQNDSTNYFMTDKIGKTGLEAQYEEYLRGKNGVEQVEINSKGNVVGNNVSSDNTQPVSGDNLTLYVNGNLQQAVATALQNGINNAKTATNDQSINAGVAAVMDVNTGGVLAMVSLPSYDNNLFSTAISTSDYQKLANDTSHPMLNRAIAGVYPPGSISKIILASAGLEEGNINANTSLVTPAAIKIGDYSFPDWKDHSYESTNVERAIAESNDIFFYALGGGYDKISGLGIDKVKKWWQLFGLGEKTGIDLPGEASGLLPDNAWKLKTKKEQWYIGDTYHASIGQGDLLVTPLQMLRATATVANGGKLLEPQLVKKITDSDGKTVKEFGPRVEQENFLSSDTLKTVQEGMRMTVTSGSAHSIFPSDFLVSVAGKTGTAQFQNNEKTHAWFECYAPYDNPQIAVIVMIEGGGEGYDIAGPVAKEILQYYFQTK